MSHQLLGCKSHLQHLAEDDQEGPLQGCPGSDNGPQHPLCCLSEPHPPHRWSPLCRHQILPQRR
ncbi:predicted protein [Plenodomus lingam JN3]|uniref:Uncharacterized protein n=1 Tax=Leptosphaeria maculans (strain JN3 / isolate v23.1.3 / race Av1-4-5-6-7-8) TaxID=985895 RepID=E5A6V3_LEPMJ|nr:predicted protein [Plenodomus lingam JN3]CBX99348.1 predicted protein [Plenodomus lingam JN3]